MFCSKCGTDNGNESLFCKSCGAKLGMTGNAESSNETSTPTYEAPTYTAPPPMVKQPYSLNPVLNKVKSVAASPLALVAIIALSVQILAEILGAFIAGNGPAYTIYRFLNMFGNQIPYEVYGVLNWFTNIGNVTYIITTILGLIPTILICIGLWMTYSSATDRTNIGLKTSGLTMIKVIYVIKNIFAFIGLLLFEIAILAITIGICSAINSYDGYYYDSSPYSGFAVAICVIIAIVVALIFTLQIIFNSKVIKSIDTAKYTINTGVPTDKISGFVAVWLIISACGLLFTLITNFFVSVLSMTSLICFAILIFKYKNAMRSVMYVNPPAVQQPTPGATSQEIN